MTPPTIPVCYRHPARETYLRCSRCDRPICPSCMNDAAVGHQCPECVAEGRRTQRQPRTALGARTDGQHGHVTKALIGINVTVALAAVVLGGAQAVAGGAWGGLLGGTTPVHIWGGLVGGPVIWTDGPGGPVVGSAAGVVNGDYYRLITSMFLHYGILHLLLNMWALWVVGGALEPALGRLRFLALYLASGLGGGVAVYLFSPPNTLTVGASGAVFGLFAGFFIIQRRLGRDTSMITGILIINLFLTFMVPNISIAGHLGGLVTGAAVAAALAYAPRQHRTAVQVAAITAVMVLLAGLTIAGTLRLS